MTEADLELLRTVREVEIETSAGAGKPVHRTTIWVVVDDRDRILVRTYRGAGSRWYREVRANPGCRLLASDRAFELNAVPGDDPDRVQACSNGLLEKYAGDPATPAMLRDEVLGTTLELVPAQPG